MAEEFFDDKTPHVLSFILPQVDRHFQSSPDTPFLIGLNGVQGAGKTVLVSSLARTLSSPPHNLPTCVFSLDDLYLTHADQVSLAQTNPQNPLLQHRGQPGTHDIPIALDIFEKLRSGSKTWIPKYNKALFSGQGDRQPESEWDEINSSSNPNKRIKIVIFEGWCVGFQSLAASDLQAKHANAVASLQASKDGDSHAYTGRLAHNTLQSVATINDSLVQYEKLWAYFNVFIHIDAHNPLFVYQWRLQQEATTKREKGGGMSDDEVRAFVDGYYPSYELYSDTLREGIFKPRGGELEGNSDADQNAGDSWRGRQLRLVVAEDRRVREVITL